MPRDRGRPPQRETSVLAVAQNRWTLWQADFAMHCVRSMFTSKEHSLTNVASPLALSTVLAMLYLGADEETKAEIAKALRIPRGIAKDVLRNFRDILPVLAGSDSEQRIRICAELFLSKDRRVKEAFAAQIQRFFGRKVQIYGDLPFDEFYKHSPEAHLFAIAATVITAPWIADSAKDCHAYPFMTSYASKVRGHPYFILSGNFRCLKSRVYEAWMFPLGISSDSDLKPALIIIRPVFIGLLMNLVARMHGFSLLGLIKRIQRKKERKSRLLIPNTKIPLGKADIFPIDLLKIDRNKGENPGWGQKSEDFSGIAEGCKKLDHLFHYGTVTITQSGVGFANDDATEPTSLVSDSTQRSSDNVPRNSKPSPEIFSARFDSPFVFVIVDCKRGIPLSIGSYSGPRSVSPSYLSRPCHRPPFCAKQNVNDRRRCVLM